MKPAPFGYHRAGSVAEAVELLAAYDGSARILAGGQSLAPMMNMRLFRPDALIDVNDIAVLGHIDPIVPPGSERAGGHQPVSSPAGTTMVLGATVRYSTLEQSPLVADRLPLLVRMVRHVGDRQVRNRGTIGGSLVHGDPAAEMPLAAMVLGASVEVAGPDGTREIAVTDLYEGTYAAALDPCEVLTEVRFPAAPAQHAFAEMCRRHNDFAVISAACVGTRDDSGRWRHVRIGLGGVADRPVLATEAAVLATGSTLDDATIVAAGFASLDAVDPPSDIRASAEYRRHLVPIYVRRVLTALRAAADDPNLVHGSAAEDHEDRR